MKDIYWLNILLSFIQTFGNSFYPLYPPMEGTPLDFSLAPEALQISCVPDILILSSDLAHFVKVMTALFLNGNYIHLGQPSSMLFFVRTNLDKRVFSTFTCKSYWIA